MKSTPSLQGKTVVITRAKKQSKEMKQLIEQHGGTAIEMPMIDFRLRKEGYEISSLFDYDWIFFTSVNSVRFFWELLQQHEIPISSLRCRFGAVGEKTKQALENKGVSVDFFPTKFTGEEFGTQFVHSAFTGKRILIPKGQLARDVLAATLRKFDYHVDEWIIYETFLPTESNHLMDPSVLKDVDVITFTSPSTVRHFFQLLEQQHLLHFVKKWLIACIGPVTASEVKKHGYDVHICPETYTVPDLIKSINEWYKMRRN
jgi:uroporphyrinogen-III synthase